MILQAHCGGCGPSGRNFEDFGTYPLNPQRSYTPATAPLENYLRMCDTVGITRTVQASAGVHGAGNSLTLTNGYGCVAFPANLLKFLLWAIYEARQGTLSDIT